ncbi:uncharacterized protein [Vicugna pacos]|uniref:Uncharacterized protein n=1 Tax=Vicugna pacos TaxID=30538 RepID=A0ABM5E5S3_VICPA
MCRPRQGGREETARFGRCPRVPRARRGAASTSVHPAAATPPLASWPRTARGRHPQGARRVHRWVPARPGLPPLPAPRGRPTRRPLAPFLSVTSYIITRANQNGSDARCRGPAPGRHWMLASQAPGPPTRRRDARLRAGEGPERRLGSSLLGEGAAAAAAGPRQEAASVTNCVSFFEHVSWAPSSQGAGCSRGGAAARAGGSPSREEKVPPGPPLVRAAPGPAAPPAPLRATPARMAGWATCDPRAPGGPLLPADGGCLPLMERKAAQMSICPFGDGQAEASYMSYPWELAVPSPVSSFSACKSVLRAAFKVAIPEVTLPQDAQDPLMTPVASSPSSLV